MMGFLERVPKNLAGRRRAGREDKTWLLFSYGGWSLENAELTPGGYLGMLGRKEDLVFQMKLADCHSCLYDYTARGDIC